MARNLASLLLGLAVAGCAVAGPANVTAAGPGVPAQSAVNLVGSQGSEAMQASLEPALRSELERQGLAISDSKARYSVHYSIAERDAAVGIAALPAEGAEDADWISERRKRGIFDACGGRRLRVNLVLFDSEQDVAVYRASAETDACDFDDAAIAGLVREAASRIVQD